jgi:hypothetical protein
MSSKFRKASKLSRPAAIADCRSTAANEVSHVLRTHAALNSGEDAAPPARVPPAPEVYRTCQIQQGLLGDEEIGGLCNYFLRDLVREKRDDQYLENLVQNFQAYSR